MPSSRGGASGIGLALSRALAEAGANVAIADVNQARLAAEEETLSFGPYQEILDAATAMPTLEL